jgi:hypothetical protein
MTLSHSTPTISYIANAIAFVGSLYFFFLNDSKSQVDALKIVTHKNWEQKDVIHTYHGKII